MSYHRTAVVPLRRHVIGPLASAELFRVKAPARTSFVAEGARHGVVCVVAGSAQIHGRRMNGGPVLRPRTRAGALSFLPAGTTVTGYMSGEFQLLSLRFQPEFVEHLFGSGARFVLSTPLIGCFDPLCVRLARELAREIVTTEVSAPFVESAATLLVVHLSRITAHFSSSVSSSAKLSAAGIRKIIDLIEADLQRPLTISQLAGSVGVSGAHFARLFRQTTGCSPHRFITERRVERARHLLDRGTLTLPEIAHEVGFNSQSHLTTQFKRIVGVTPGRYRLNKLFK